MSVFSPLALTKALPFLPLAQGDIDYQVQRRAEPGLFDTLFKDRGTTVILVRAGQLAVPRGQGERVDYANVKMRLAELPGDYIASQLHRYPQVVPLFLGSYGNSADGGCVVALDITRMDTSDAGSSMVEDAANGQSDAAFAEAGNRDGDSPDDDGREPSVLSEANERFDWVDLRGFAPHASARQAGQATSAATLSIWHMRQRHCPVCGAPVRGTQGGWAQRCTSEADGNRLLFPHIEPAVIVAVVDAQDRLLLQHNLAWGDTSLYSVCAGFVEAGENLEHACRRESLEETGIKLGELRYLGSQPWPFPASLMVAFKARALSHTVHVDGGETGDARWFSRDDYTKEIIAGRISPPGKATIARFMIEEWYGRELE